MRTYLAGPMRGHENLNFPAFHDAAAKLRRSGCEVFNPAELPPEVHDDLRECFRRDMEFICKHADAIALLPGWRNSKGATAEHAVAKALGLTVIEL